MPSHVDIPHMSGAELRVIREHLGLTQVEMAYALGTQERVYQRWEAGDARMLGPAVLLALRLLDDHEEVIKKASVAA